MEKSNGKKLLTRRVFILSILSVLLVVSIVVLSLSMRLRAPEASTICGLDTSDMLYSDAEILLEEAVHTYSLNLIVGDQSIRISTDDLGLIFLKENFKSVVQNMSDSGQPADPWSVISIDHDKLAAFLMKNFDQKQTASVPATVAWDDAEGMFKVIPGIPEHWYDAGVLCDLVADAIVDLPAELVVQEDSLYMERHDLEQLKNVELLANRANELLKLELEYVFNPRKVELDRKVIDASMIASFLRFDYENGVVFADENAVATYVDSFASEYSYFKHKDRFVTHGGDRIDIKIPFQEQTVDTQALTNLIVESIANGQSGTFEVPYSGFVNFEGDYIEVSIPEQHLWVYQDGVMVLESDVVTGNESIGKKTPTGINYVRGHLQNITLFGDYFVNYWMAITRGGVYGFHDADGWREPEEYGGDTYKSHGSGGCVNVPLENMAKMYEIVADATPIVIYNMYFYD